MSRKKNQKKVVQKLGTITNFDKALETENSIAKIQPLKDRPFYQIITDTHTGETTRILVKPNRHKAIY